jgi:polyhydroxyalkanoate synthesis regulator protein
MLDSGRQADIDYLKKEYRKVSPKMRRQIDMVAKKIYNESPYTRSMREALIKAVREQRRDNVDDIHDYFEKHQRKW